MAGRKNKPDPVRAILKGYSGAQMRGELSNMLPAIKGKVKERVAKQRMGRPTTYDPAIGERICDLMSEGVPLTEACDSLGLTRSTVHGWARRNEDFATALAHAREALAEHAFSEASAIPRRLLEIYERDPDAKLDPARVSAAKLASDVMRWYAERMAPRTFADKTRKIEVSGPNGAPIQVAAVTIDAAALSDEQREILRLALRQAQDAGPEREDVSEPE